MKKVLVCALLMLLVFCGGAFAAQDEFGMTSDDIYRLAKAPSTDPIVGVWEGYLPLDLRNGKTAHYAIVPDVNKARPEWDYLVFCLEDTTSYFKAGELKMILKRTGHPNVYYVKTIDKDSLSVYNTEGPVLMLGSILDFARLSFSELVRTKIVLMVKAPAFVPDWYKEPKPDSSSLWEQLKTN